MRKEELKLLVARLIQLGDNRVELEHWVEIYQDLDEAQKLKLDQILLDELKTLTGTP